MKRMTIAMVVLSLCFLLAVQVSMGTEPVKHKSEGCVIGGKVYSFYQEKTVYLFTLPEGFNLKPYEGKKVLLEGMLAPSDDFQPKEKTLKILGPCDAASKKLISKMK
jgi:hypothetical protein